MSSPPASPPSSHGGSAADILTPTRKVQALLARFDDSDEDDDAPIQRPSATRSGAMALSEHNSSQEDSEDDVQVARKSRMAARLASEGEGTADRVVNDRTWKQHSSQSPPHASNKLPTSSQPPPSSEDELSRLAPRKRLLLKRKSSPAAKSSPPQKPDVSPSSMFFPLPGASGDQRPSSPPRQDSDSEDLPDNPFDGPKSKFKALVEKHRVQRLEKEAAEAAKRDARRETIGDSDKPRKQRGLSPADDSNEDSDSSALSAAKKLTQEAKPARKASRKAVEEMKRETQRMSRNMQLAHQARTKKKITKESLLAKFNFTIMTSIGPQPVTGNTSTAASSDTGSDAEEKDHTTPPTSPPQEPMEVDKEQRSFVQTISEDEPSLADRLVLEAPPLGELGAVNPLHLDKGKGKAIDMPSATAVEPIAAAPVQIQAPQLLSFESINRAADKKVRLRELLRKRPAETDDEDLDVVTARGDRRKYAAFEKLPKRKALETSSHLALRSLAHLHDSDKGSRFSMNPAELELSLRKAARMQAKAERQQKIDELRAKGVVIQTAEERERDQQEVEDLVERARQEAAEIQKREKELAKKNGTYVKDGMDSDESDDADFEDFADDADSGDEDGEDDDEEAEKPANDDGELVDDAAEETGSEEDEFGSSEEEAEESEHAEDVPEHLPRKSRQSRIIADDEDDDPGVPIAESPKIPAPAKTPQSLTRSARKQIPGLNMSDDLAICLSQAFAATMADSQTQEDSQIQEQDSYDIIRELPSPGVALMPRLNRLESVDMISESQPSQSQPLDINLSLSQSQQVPESPLMMRGVAGSQFTPSQAPFEPTQDGGYLFSPFQGNRFDTPQHAPHSTVDTVILPNEVDASPVMQRRGRLQRGRVATADSDDEPAPETDTSAFAVMKRAAKKADQQVFDKTKSNAREIIDEAAEESDDEYAGLGGASDDDLNDAENDDDRQMIDHDTQVGRGDEAKLAGLYADRERQNDEAAVSKLLKDITTGGLRRKRGINDDLDISDDEDAFARQREARQRKNAKMFRELLRDEAVGKIAEDKKKEAFLRSIEDREPASDDDDFDEPETPAEESQSQSQAPPSATEEEPARTSDNGKRPLDATSDSQLNRLPPSLRRPNRSHTKKPSTLAEIRESVSFLIDEPDSQGAVIDLGLSDSEEEPEAYVDLDRHLEIAEADENAADSDDDEGLGDFIVDDDENAKNSQEDSIFKKPAVPPIRASFAERRTRTNVVNRLNLLRQSSSTSSNSGSTKMAFYTSTSSTGSFKGPSLLRRATTNSSISSISSTENVSATGVTTARTERGNASQDKEFIRKGKGSNRNAVNYLGPARMTVREEKMSQRAGITKKAKKSGKGGFLGGLFGGGSWG